MYSNSVNPIWTKTYLKMTQLNFVQGTSDSTAFITFF